MRVPETDRLIETGDNLAGTFQSLKHNLSFMLVADPEYRGDERHPTHIVLLVLSPTKAVKAGAAWKRKMMRGPNSGAFMFSITIDDPSFDAPINIAAFPGAEPGQYEVVWKRQRAAAPAASPGGPSANGAPPPDDRGDPGPDPRY